MVVMEKILFSIVLLGAFLLSFDSLTSGPKESKLSDEIMWLFNEPLVLEKMDKIGTKKLIENLNRAHYEQLSLESSQESERMAKILLHANELDKAHQHFDEVQRSYQNENPKLIEQTADFVLRTKKSLLRELRNYHADDESLVRLFQ